MPDLTVPFSVYCSCGEGLCHATDVKYERYEHVLTVEPCEKCMKRERDEGYDEGWERGYASEEK